MTLTDQLPSLRRTLPDPLAIDAWPEATRARVDDVLVGGLSAHAVASVSGTPCALVGAAVLAGTGGLPASDAVTSVVVAMVVSVAPAGADAGVRLDVDPRGVALVWDEARLVGRASTARRGPVPILVGDATVAAPRLVADLHAGDLLAIPCAGRIRVDDGALALDRVEARHVDAARWLAALG